MNWFKKITQLFFTKILTQLIYYLGSKKWLMTSMESAVLSVKLTKFKSELLHHGINLRVHFPVTIAQPEKVTFGDDVALAPYVHIWGGGGVTVGNRVMIGTHTSISSLTHDYSQQYMYNTLISKPVVIEDDVWIGSNVVILPGVTIKHGAVIGAGAVVTQDVDTKAIMVGVPAKLLRYRNTI